MLTDLRQAARSYARSPGLTATLVLTVAAGAGGNAAILTFIGGFRTHLTAVSEMADAGQFARVTLLLLSTSAMVLLLASATVAGLLLSRASARTRETAIKVSLGATRRHLAWQCVAESLLIALAGGLIAVLIGWWTSRLVPMLLFAEDAAQMTWSPDIRWLIATTAVWMIVITICGLVPAIGVSQQAPLGILKDEAANLSRSGGRVRRYLVIAQIALCALLVEGASIIGEDLHATVRTSRGQAVGSLLIAEVRASAGFGDEAGGLRYLAAARDKVSTIPGVTATSWIATLPASRAAAQAFVVEPASANWPEIRLDVGTLASSDRGRGRLNAVSGRLFAVRDGPDACRVAVVNQDAANRYFAGDAVGRALEGADGRFVQIIGVLPPAVEHRPERPSLYYDDTQVPGNGRVSRDMLFYASSIGARPPPVTTDVNVVSPDYFTVFADPPVEGRVFTRADGPDACRVAVVTSAAERTVFGGHAVDGAVVDPNGNRIDVVGVVRAEALGAAERAPSPEVLMPLDQAYAPIMRLAIHTTDTSPAFRARIEDALRAVPGGSLWSPVETMEATLARTSLAPERIASALVAACAILALVVSLAGVAAVMADQVARRRRELALRVALGARSWRLVGSVAREGLRLTVLGQAVGIVVALASAPLLRRIVVHSSFPSPLALVIAASAVGVLVTLAAALPAWRIVRVDPREMIQGG